MVKTKHATSAVKWTNKNRHYLERLGFLDGRTGRQRKDAPSISRFINECMTMCLEGGYFGKLMLSPDELAESWIKFQVAQKNKAIEENIAEINRLRGMMIKH